MTNTPPAQPLRHPLIELLARYRAIFTAAWSIRHELAGPKRLTDEAAFLPAALSLQETPPHPAPRRAAWALCALFLIALVWSMVGEIDIVAVAHGRIVVSDRTKTVQPLEASVVRRVRVRDGDTVQAGQALVELDSTNANADQTSVREQLSAAVSEEVRATALLNALRLGKPPSLPLPLGEGGGEGAASARPNHRPPTSKPSGKTSTPSSPSSPPSTRAEKPKPRPSAN